jgi:DDE superfamily endonuclease
VAYASEKGSTLVDQELHLPREWADDPQRRSEAGVPEEVRFATKGRLAGVMLRRAFEAEVLAKWVVADSIYGADTKFRRWLEVRGNCYVLPVHNSTGAWHTGHRYQVRTLARGLQEASWVRTSAREGSKGDRLHDRACLALEDGLEEVEMRRWLLVRRDIDEPDEQTFYLAYAPAETSVASLSLTLVAACSGSPGRSPGSAGSSARRSRSFRRCSRCRAGRRSGRRSAFLPAARGRAPQERRAPPESGT